MTRVKKRAGLVRKIAEDILIDPAILALPTQVLARDAQTRFRTSSYIAHDAVALAQRKHRREVRHASA